MRAHPYLFPGLQGTMARPTPSGYPTPMETLDVCCEVFETYGRNCGQYKSHRQTSLPRIDRNSVIGQVSTLRILSDLFKAWSIIVRESTRWHDTHRSRPHRYTSAFLGQTANRSESSVRMAIASARVLIKHDACFRSMYLLCIRQLMDRKHRVDVHPSFLDELHRLAA